jgi:hypothetical protein
MSKKYYNYDEVGMAVREKNRRMKSMMGKRPDLKKEHMEMDGNMVLTQENLTDLCDKLYKADDK